MSWASQLNTFIRQEKHTAKIGFILIITDIVVRLSSEKKMMHIITKSVIIFEEMSHIPCMLEHFFTP